MTGEVPASGNDDIEKSFQEFLASELQAGSLAQQHAEVLVKSTKDWQADTIRFLVTSGYDLSQLTSDLRTNDRYMLTVEPATIPVVTLLLGADIAAIKRKLKDQEPGLETRAEIERLKIESATELVLAYGNQAPQPLLAALDALVPGDPIVSDKPEENLFTNSYGAAYAAVRKPEMESHKLQVRLAPVIKKILTLEFGAREESDHLVPTIIDLAIARVRGTLFVEEDPTAMDILKNGYPNQEKKLVTVIGKLCEMIIDEGIETALDPEKWPDTEKNFNPNV